MLSRVFRKKFRTTLDRRRSLPARSVLQPGDGTPGQAGQSSHSWKLDARHFSEEAACSVGDSGAPVASWVRGGTGELFKDKPRGFILLSPTRCLACRLSGAIPLFRVSQSSPAGRWGSWWQPTSCSCGPVRHQEGGSASDPRRLPVPGVSPQRAIRTFWRPQPPEDPPYHRELKFGAECVGTYFSPRPPSPGLRAWGVSVVPSPPCPLPLLHPRAWLFGWQKGVRSTFQRIMSILAGMCLLVMVVVTWMVASMSLTGSCTLIYVFCSSIFWNIALFFSQGFFGSLMSFVISYKF